MASECNSSGHTKRRGCSASPFCKCRYVSKYIGRIVRFGAFLPCKRQHRAVQTADFCSNILGGRGLACAQPIGDETDRPGQDVGEQALRFAARQGRRRALETASALSAELGEGFTVLTLQENKSVATAESYCEKVSVIAAVFPVFFILVAALVVMTTMTRMIEEERAIIGCLRSLGGGRRARRGAGLCASAMRVGISGFRLPRRRAVVLVSGELFPRLALRGHYRPSAQFQNSPHRHGGIAQGERINFFRSKAKQKSAPQRRAFCHG